MQGACQASRGPSSAKSALFRWARRRTRLRLRSDSERAIGGGGGTIAAMVQVTISAEDLPEPVQIQLGPGTRVLLGREPDPTRLPAPLRGPDLQLCVLPSQRVSANHLLLHGQADGVYVQDLHSRNGSFLRLPPGQSVGRPADQPVVLELAGHPQGPLKKARVPRPADAQWSSPAEFAGRVAAEINAFLARASSTAQVVPGPAGGADVSGALGLADGSHLFLVEDADATQVVADADVADEVRAYVNRQNLRFEKELGLEEDFVLASPRLREAHRQLVDAAAFGTRLMLLGPTGAGKDRLARRYHQRSPQRGGPFISVNCALLQEDLLYAQLFGAKKGSFTGCVADITGYVESAHQGTLFLDEVGEMDLGVQKALLRFLDTRGEYSRLGDPRKHTASVQLCCATNVALDDAAVRHGKFRDDLWYRLAVQVVRVPPLRERPEDIVAYLKRRRLRGNGMPVLEALDREALQLVLSDPWPGNFRDLDNFAERLPPATRPQELDAATCQWALSQGRGQGPAASPPADELALSPDAGGFGDINDRALQAFAEDHGGPPREWGQLQLFNEKYLKPVFVAEALGLAWIDGLSRELNYSELARRLHVADGTTVKMHLRRYVERFRQRGPEAP